ncbi:MAG: TM2 domain-containing protein [Microscillaceae bacterium]|nr:TM2 domain-containing protein [Microscillaceae bacterium]
MANEGKKDKIIAAILAWFLGIFGIHRFYLGQTGMGIGYLLGTITIVGAVITGIISFVDFVGLLIMPQETFDRRYNPQLYSG